MSKIQQKQEHTFRIYKKKKYIDRSICLLKTIGPSESDDESWAAFSDTIASTALSAIVNSFKHSFQHSAPLHKTLAVIKKKEPFSYTETLFMP